MPKGLLSATISPELLMELHRLKEKGVNVSHVVEAALQAYFEQEKRRGKPPTSQQQSEVREP